MAALKQANMSNQEIQETPNKWGWLFNPFRPKSTPAPQTKEPEVSEVQETVAPDSQFANSETTQALLEAGKPSTEAATSGQAPFVVGVDHAVGEDCSVVIVATITPGSQSQSLTVVGSAVLTAPDQDVLASLSQPLPVETTRKVPDPHEVDQPAVIKLPLPAPVANQTVQEAQELIQQAVQKNQTVLCACCGKQAIPNRHTINFMATEGLRFIVSSWRMAKGSVQGVRVNGNPKTPEEVLKSRNYSKLQYWGMLEKVDGQKDFWKPTQAGLDFVDGKLAMPTTVITYDGEPIGYAGKHVYIHQITRPNTRTED